MDKQRAVKAATSTFGVELRAQRVLKGLSLSRLSTLVHYDKGHLSRVERGLTMPTAELARACDEALQADGQLLALHDIEAVRPTAGPRPAQLPGAPTIFVGRSYHLRRITELVGDDQRPGAVAIVAIDGPPGVGKTSLALSWAHQAQDSFPDGVLFADLAGYGPNPNPATPSEILEGFLRALGVEADRIPVEESQRTALYRSLLHQQRVLVVLDNAVDSGQVRPLLPGSETCVVVATSRTRLSGLVITDAAVGITLNPLSPNESIGLIRTIIGDPRADADPQAVASIAHRCAYLPLALRIAAERLVAHPRRAVTELATDLIAEGDRLDVLTAGDDDTLALRAVFSWSYRTLGDKEALLFRQMGLHRGPYLSAEAAAALAGLPVARTRLLLTRLVEAHLVEQLDSGTYRLLGLLRPYAFQLAEETDLLDDSALAVARLVRWYQYSAHAAYRMLTPNCPDLHLAPPGHGIHPLRFASYEEAVAWCEAEQANFAPVLAAGRQGGLNIACWQLAAVLIGYFLLRKPWGTWVATQQIGAEAAQAAGDPLAEAWVRANLGEAHRQQRQLDDAQRHFEFALYLSCHEPAALGHCWALAGMGFLAMDRKQYGEAVNALDKVVGYFGTSGYLYGEATVFAALGDAYRGLGDLDRALYYGGQALELFQVIHDRKSQGDTLIRLARTAGARREFDLAYAYCAEALAAHRECGDRWSEAADLQEKGNLLILSGSDVSGAHKYWRSALEIFEDIDRLKAAEILAILP
ncbi:ATP-binding protein [Crossiella cryophila]|uniref:Tetratricopeptide (TPR) repeat protein n=1 Tax=Crossiella cryophila TaxID=43355 RepID=A0A7W7FSN7_9PSEU|nr:helix-turn-helix domain-containing protein [Crossiella cryophila]MBB4677241.1 tetratricopeptide (TPR) repeat protein [Crossiella cryophila]